LKEYVRAGTEFDWCGQKVLLRKLSAQEHLDLFGKASSAEQPSDAEADRADTVAFHINIIANSLLNSDGTLAVTNDASRAVLRDDVAYDDLCLLSELALKHSGYGAEQKKS
jgi:hypothetical protein